MIGVDKDTDDVWFFDEVNSSWSKLPVHAPMRSVSINDDGDFIIGASKSGQVFYRVGLDNNQPWILMEGPPMKQIEVSDNTRHIYGLTETGEVMYKMFNWREERE
jgi:hypothetical protein